MYWLTSLIITPVNQEQGTDRTHNPRDKLGDNVHACNTVNNNVMCKTVPGEYRISGQAL